MAARRLSGIFFHHCDERLHLDIGDLLLVHVHRRIVEAPELQQVHDHAAILSLW